MTDPTLSPTKNSPAPAPPGSKLVTLAIPLFALKTRYTSPLDDKDKALPPHRWTAVGSKPGSDVLVQHLGSPSDAGGASSIGADADFSDPKTSWHFFWQPVFDDPADLADWTKQQEAWIDLDKNAWVAPGKVQPLDKRRLIRMPLWTTPLKAKSGGFNDSPNPDFTSTGLLKGDAVAAKVKASDTFGTGAKPWLFLVDYKWFRTFLRFAFYNFKKKDRDAIPPGLVVRARKAGNKVVGGGSAIDPNGTLFVLHQQTKDDAKGNVDYYFETPASFSLVDLDVAAPAGPPPEKDDRATTVAKIPDGGPIKRYLLPAAWHSNGMEAFLDDGNNPPARKPFNDLRGEDTTKDKPLAFHLDDFVLFDVATTARVSLPADSRLTAFDHRMKFKGPFDPVFVHMLQDKVKGDYFRAEERFAKKDDEVRDASFVFNHEADFFVLRDGRISGPPEQTKYLGAKMAAARAPENPIGDFLGGYPSLSNAGTVQLHLFPDAYDGPYDEAQEGKFLKDHPKAKLGHLLVYVPLKVGAAVVGAAAINAPTAADLIPAASMNPVYQALVDSAVRWDQAQPANGATGKKDYVLVPDAGVNDATRVLKMRHFFGARTDGNHKFTILGCYKNGLSVGDRSFVQGKTMNLVVSPRPPASPSWTFGPSSQDSDNVTLDCFVLAHELGHTMGLPDEYGENLAITATPAVNTTAEPRIIRFGQQHEGYPFYADLDALQRFLRLPRLRYVWHHVDAFLNNGAGKAQLPEGPYVAQDSAFRQGTIHKIADGNATSPWTLLGQAAGPGGRSNLVLYRSGDDEATVERMFARPAANGTKPGDWLQGILVVSPKIWFNFLASAAGDFPNHATRFGVLQNFHKDLFTASMTMKQSFFIDGGTKLPRIGILFQPRIEFGPVPQPRSGFAPPNVTEGDADVVVDVVFGAAPAVATVPPGWPPSAKPRLQLYLGDAHLALLRFALNIAPGSPPNNAPITAAELAPLATAVQTLLGDAATDPPRTVKDLPP